MGNFARGDLTTRARARRAGVPDGHRNARNQSADVDAGRTLGRMPSSRAETMQPRPKGR